MILYKLNTIYTICNVDIYSGTKVLEFGSSTPPAPKKDMDGEKNIHTHTKGTLLDTGTER